MVRFHSVGRAAQEAEANGKLEDLRRQSFLVVSGSLRDRCDCCCCWDDFYQQRREPVRLLQFLQPAVHGSVRDNRGPFTEEM